MQAALTWWLHDCCHSQTSSEKSPGRPRLAQELVLSAQDRLQGPATMHLLLYTTATAPWAAQFTWNKENRNFLNDWGKPRETRTQLVP